MITVVAALIERDNRFLIGQRRADQAHPLKWEFPGGKVEAGEKPRDALARELWEELEIRAAIGPEIARYQYTYGAKPPMELIFYEVDEFSGPPRNRIFERIAWVERLELAARDFLEGDVDLVKRLSGP
ncbi:MAG: (deoxy)nucleoside triphosphate pyrophosphohydrolase [Acidobacteriota bacterium]|nr:(deoxy)nucleoside triphosphate pyrophosphohydrolase [Acidobacteriota bacterium]